LNSGLGSYWPALAELLVPLSKSKFEQAGRLFHVIRETRNDAVHQGAWARHKAEHLTTLFLLLEEAMTLALMSKPDLTAQDLMITKPVIAESWHLLAHVRTLMLSNSFSYLPYPVEEDGTKQWHLLSDMAILKWIGQALTDPKKKSARLSFSVKQALEYQQDHEPGPLTISEATVRPPTASLSELTDRLEKDPEPILIVEDGRLLGLITAFDVM
ncbi:MAG: hypothetical protein KDB96_13445, partial [Flavobacteriales bacterium]|nr:hypothetical protein [Flavobacteriales bacterium]